MRILIDGQVVGELSAKDEKQLTLCADREIAEGRVMSVDEAVAGSGRRFRLAAGILGGMAAVILGGALVMAASYEPRDLALLVPFMLILVAALVVAVRFIYRRRLAGTRAALTPRLARMAPVGAPVRVDGFGVSLDGRQADWLDFSIGSVEFRRIPVNEGPDMTIIESLILDHPGGQLILDSGVMTNGRAIVDKTWRHLRAGR